jgi:CheY-like chemotaxis protein
MAEISTLYKTCSSYVILAEEKPYSAFNSMKQACFLPLRLRNQMKNQMSVIPKILFIDDDPDDLEMYSESMRNADASVIIEEANSGIEALEYLRKAKVYNSLPTLIVLDVNMPMMGGKETLEEIKKDKDLQNIPIVIFSTASSPKEKECFEDYNVDFYTKPCSFSEMKEVAEKLLSYCA